ncbi:MAG: hypothetical protein WKF37_24565 [Bryobacteraceae bacterium]
MRTLVLTAAFFAISAAAAEKYNGPRPPKADVPYLLHADNLIETEAGAARQENRKDTQVASLPGTSSPARTPPSNRSSL